MVSVVAVAAAAAAAAPHQQHHHYFIYKFRYSQYSNRCSPGLRTNICLLCLPICMCYLLGCVMIQYTCTPETANKIRRTTSVSAYLYVCVCVCVPISTRYYYILRYEPNESKEIRSKANEVTATARHQQQQTFSFLLVRATKKIK